VVVDDIMEIPLPNLFFTSLDAGPSVSVTGPNGSRSVPRQIQPDSITYSLALESGDYLAPGTYTISGEGGPDVGAFSGSLNVAPELLWTNRASLSVVDRSQPLQVTWSGGEPSTLVFIQGTSFVVDIDTGEEVTGASFTCVANNTAGQFTVPASVLGQLPASSRIDAGGFSFVMRGSLAIASTGTGVRMFASGVDYLTAGNQWGIAQSTEYK
jgi:hypothetical protein